MALSKRELAAKKAGGVLNYKTGKISVPVQAPSVRQTASKSVAPLVGAGPLMTGQSRVSSEGPAIGPLLPGQTRAESQTSTSKPKSAKPVSPSSSVKAAEASGLLGTMSKVPSISAISSDTRGPISKAASRIANSGISTFNDFMTGLGKMYTNNGLVQAAPVTFYTPEQKQAIINDSLGIKTSLASDVPTGYGPNGEQYFNGFDPQKEGGLMFQSDFATPGTNFSRPGSEQAYARGVSPIAYGNQESKKEVAYGASPTPVYNPERLATPQGTNIAPRTPRQISGSSFISPSFTPQVQQISPQVGGSFISQPDNTPVDNGQSGTRRQFLGNGLLGNGMASNGKLDSGLDGLSFGANPMDNEQNIINQLLGINTAQAAEAPQTNMSFGDSTTPISAFQQSFANGGLTMDQGYSMPQQFGPTNQGTLNPTIADIQNNAGQDKRNVPKPTNTVAQFAQGATGGNSTSNPMLDYQKQSLKGFSAQEKAQKKALDELLKSIKNQYNTKQESGLQDLNKAKQEDLLKLSGLFSFANQDPNSEQRIQYEQRANQDYAGQQTDFLAKLAAAMSGDISQAKQGYQGKLADINSQKNAAREKIAQLLSQAQQQRGRVAAQPKPAKVTHNDVFNFVNESLANGATWQEIADGARAQGVDTSTGSYLDQLLNNANKRNSFAQ